MWGYAKKIASDQEPAVRIPRVVAPVQVEIALHGTAIEIRDMAIAIQDAGRAAKLCKTLSASPPIDYSPG